MSHTRRKIMVLGAGPGQMPLIRESVDRGFFVITVDNIPENMGHRVSTQAVDCSTVDRDGVLAAARAIGIDGVVTLASDVATPTMGHVADTLGLPGPTWEAATTMANKGRFRRFQQAGSFPCPRFVVGNALETMMTDLHELALPFVVKPTDASGSRGITTITDWSPARLEQAITHARQSSLSGTVCVEEFVEGHDVSGDGLLVDGVLSLAITRKHTKNLIPIAHALPTQLSPSEQNAVHGQVERLCDALGYRNGPIDVDVRVSGETATVIEMSPRLGGNAIPALIKYATGVDLVSASIDYAMGHPIRKPTLTVRQACAALILGAEQEGVVSHVSGPDVVMRQVPEVLHCQLAVQPGDTVRAFRDSPSAIGQVIVAARDDCELSAVRARVHEALALTVCPAEELEENQ